MNRLITVARYHLVDRTPYVTLPIAVLMFTFLVNLAIFGLIGPQQDNYTGALLSLYVFLFVSGVLSVTKSLPFGLTLGMSRRTYYLGTLGLIVGLATVYSLGVAGLQALERLTGGWGMAVHFFRVPWILDGAWYLTWLTSFVLLLLMFLYGMWFGLINRRWAVVGTVVFAAAQVVVLLGAAALITVLSAWQAVGRFFATLDVLGLVGVLALVVVALGVGGFVTMRRVTV